MQVSVKLKNAEGFRPDFWNLIIYDRRGVEWQIKEYIPINEAAVFDVPDSWEFPLDVELSIFRWVEYEVSVICVYRMQSYAPSADAYLNAKIPSAGFYYFNLGLPTPAFEKYAEEVVPPVEGLGLAIAAAAVLGLGALALGAYALGRPKEAK